MDLDRKVLGVDLGGTKIAVSVWTADGRRLSRRRFETIPGPPEPNLERIALVGRELLGGARPEAV